MMNRVLPIALAGLAGAAMLVALIAFRPASRNMPAAENSMPIKMVVPEFELLNRDGRVVSHELLEEQYTLLDFFFTSCPLYCPGMTAAMQQVDAATPDSLRLMSISIDGEYDTPEVIGAYADQFEIDSSRWVFLTGNQSQVWPMIQSLGFLVEIDRSTTVTAGNGESRDMITHPTRLLLVGPDRTVLGMARYTDRDQLDALIVQINGLLD